MSEFEPRLWRHYNDRTPESRLLRVLEHYAVDWWRTGGAIKFITSNNEVVRYAELALDNCDASINQVTGGRYPRYSTDGL